MFEFSHQLQRSLSGVRQFHGQTALTERVNNWFSIPVGELWGMPTWGHPLHQYLHETIDDDLLSVIDMHVSSKIEHDLPDVTVKAIHSKKTDESDMFIVSIQVSSLEGGDVIIRKTTETI